MDYRKTVALNSGHEMPVIGLGVFTLKEKDKDVVTKIITEGGYRHIDTAAIYGNETIIGEAIEEVLQSGISREDLFITTKIWRSDYHDPVSACKESLKNLKLDYVDLYLVHWSANTMTEDKKGFKNPMHKVWAGMEKCVEEGLTKSIGISNFNVQLICDMLAYCNIKPAVNQIELHPYLQQPELVQFCQERDIVVVGHTPLSNPARPVGSSAGIVLDDPVIKEIADKHGKTPAQIALSWNIKRSNGIISFFRCCGHPKNNKSR
jgi:diketogulonate reductase-like aldo/keto reductase